MPKRNQIKTDWIRECCTECYEGIPCDYPQCSCTPENKKEREQDYRNHLRHEAERERDRRIADHIDGYDRDDLGESPDV